MEIIPAIDIIEGKCVRLSKGDFASSKIYNEDPLEVALRFQDAGLTRLHLVDLDGARIGKIVNYHVLERIASKTSLVIDAGGGIQTSEAARVIFASGASMINVGTIAVKDPPTVIQWLKEYGSGKVILGADVRENYIAILGWQNKSQSKLSDFIRNWTEEGITYAICTEISHDGMLQGPATALYSSLLEQFKELKLIASGGVSKIDDLVELNKIGLFGVVIGKAIYENRIQLNDLTNFILKQEESSEI
jgi:phosphoribosylformimino-5-aminoimidazole carboxamide ribotide isomerase